MDSTSELFVDVRRQRTRFTSDQRECWPGDSIDQVPTTQMTMKLSVRPVTENEIVIVVLFVSFFLLMLVMRIERKEECIG